MNRAMTPEAYWDREVAEFDSIYSHNNGIVKTLLDKVFRRDMYLRFDFTLEHAGQTKDRSFLDVGCGTGLYSLELAKRQARRVVGLDVSRNMIDVCTQRAAQQGLSSQCTFLHTDLFRYNTDDLFDVSIGIGLFDYIEEPLPLISKMRALTRDKVIASFPRLWTWRAPVRSLRLRLRGCKVFFYKRKQVERLFRDAGFADFEIQRVGKLYCVVGRV